MMVGDDIKWATIQIRSELRKGPDDCQAFFLRNSVVGLGFRKRTTCICHDIFREPRFAFRTDSAEANTADIRVYRCRGRRVVVA